ncbi:MAG: DUF2950 domain-containing protein [Dissulfurispiraceae bacterium]|jgi:hypothetical protein
MEDRIMFGYKTGWEKVFKYGLAAVITNMFLVTALSFAAPVQDLKQEKFKSPEDALRALVEATRTNDTAELLAIFGPQGKDIISSGDAVADSISRERFVKAAGEAIKFSKLDDNTVLAVVGKDACSFPVPIVKSGQGWIFSTDEGKQEIINRRIGKNELSTIKVALAYVDAQREYAVKDHDGSGILQYAQHFLSHEGKKDGLYWEAAGGEDSSPLGPLVARAAEEGYSVRKPGEKHDHKPYHGYYFRILKSQGSNAPGGAGDYTIDGRMTAGFGLIAYPAEYGVSGIMTFLVNQQGIVYEKDLGPKTEDLAKSMTKYDPDKTWKKAE